MTVVFVSKWRVAYRASCAIIEPILGQIETVLYQSLSSDPRSLNRALFEAAAEA